MKQDECQRVYTITTEAYEDYHIIALKTKADQNGKPSYIYVTANSKEEAIQKAESILKGMNTQSCK